MDNRMENIDRFFNERLVNYEQIPPDANWEKISQRLGRKQRKRSAILILRIAAGMALLLSTGIGVYMLTKPNSNPGTYAVAPTRSGEMNANQSENKTASVQQATTRHNQHINTRNLRNEEIQQTSEIKPPTGNSGKKEIPLSEAPLVNNHKMVIAQHIDNVMATENSLTSLSGIYPDRLQQKEISRDISFNTNHIQPEAVLITTPDDYLEAFTPNDDQAKKLGRWTIGGEVAPLYSYRTISSDELQQVTMNELNENENGLLAYSGGVRVAFSAGKRLSVQSGFYYSRYGQQTNNIETVAVNYLSTMQGKLESETYVSVTNSTGVISKTNSNADKISLVAQGNIEGVSNYNHYDGFLAGSNANPAFLEINPEDITLTQYFDYLEVPLVLRYKIIDRKIDFNLTGGVITNFLFSNKVNITRDGDTEFFGETTDINYINYQGSVGMGIEYPVSKGFSFTVEPRFRYYINPIDRAAEINVHPYSFGFYAGFNYLF